MEEIRNLLVAHPLLHDGFFRRSVIFLVFPDNMNGAMGFVMNFRTNLFLKDVRPGMKNGNIPLYSGGPVSNNNLFYIHDLGDRLAESTQIGPNLYMGGNYDVLIDYIESGIVNEKNVRFFIGYSGWSEGQLTEEIRNNAWLTTNIDYKETLKYMTIDAWADYLYKIKRSLRIFGEIGYDISLN
jgi:putative transcriptional regulator